MRRSRAFALVSFVFVSILAAACGGGSSSSSSTPSSSSSSAAAGATGGGALDACKLITVEEAAAATGATVTAANPTASAGSASCIYAGADGSPVVSSVLQSGTTAIGAYLDDAANEKVSGVGDQAVIFRASGAGGPTGRTIYLRKGDKGFVLNVHVDDLDDAAAKTMLVKLGTTAAGRI